MRALPYLAIVLMLPGLFALLRALDPPGGPDVLPAAASQRATTVVVAEPDDPYRALAEEIAAGEGVPLVDDWDRALLRRPDFALWVASPARFTDAVLAAAGTALRDAGAATAAGIITGSSVGSARSLYRRADRASGRRAVAVHGRYPAAGVDAPRLRWVGEPGGRAGEGPDSGRPRWRPASLAAVKQALVEAGYVTFTGHGTATSWRLAPGPGGTLRAGDLPRLWNTVVSAGAYRTLRPGAADSIALAFLDRRAAAYTGFVHTPVEGYLVGGFGELPLRHTWGGFTVGQVVRLQNAAAGKAFARFPIYWLLGDPRIALERVRPYRTRKLTASAEMVRIRLSGVPAGWLPARIPGAAGYDHVRVRHAGGEIATWQGKPLYDADIQVADQDSAKLVLVRTAGGEVSIELRRRPPSFGIPAAAAVVAGALDHTLIHLPRGGGDLIALLAGVVALGGAVSMSRRRGGGHRCLVPAVVLGASFGTVHALWSEARLDAVTITSKSVWSSPLAWVATGVLVAAATWIHLAARSRRGRVVAVLVATFPAWAATAFALAMYLGPEALFRGRPGPSPYSAVMALPAAIGTLVQAGLFILAASAVRRLGPRRPVSGSPPEGPPGARGAGPAGNPG